MKISETFDITFVITSHSPTTIALAPTGSVYVVKDNQISSAEKDSAISGLLDGVSHISVDPENSRQVFVESYIDAEIYQKLFAVRSARSDRLDSLRSLHFVNSGASVRGLVDWDSKNSHEEQITVLAMNEAYAIENLALDPICIGLLLDFAEQQSVATLCGTDAQLEDVLSRNDLLQNIYDWCISKVFGRHNNRLVHYEYVGGQAINADSTYLRMNGHLLETKIFERLPEVKSLFKHGSEN